MVANHGVELIFKLQALFLFILHIFITGVLRTVLQPVNLVVGIVVFVE